MTANTIVVAPLACLSAVASEWRPNDAVSLMSPGAHLAAIDGVPPERHTILRFNDIVEERAGLIAPNEEHAERLVAAVAAWSGARPLLLHCWFGVSRSPAAAMIALAAHAPALSAEHIADALRDASPTATPNALMIAHADRLLGRNGALVAAAARIGRGRDVDGDVPAFSLRVPE